MVCISYRAYRQNLEDQMMQTAENLSRAAAAQVTAETKQATLAFADYLRMNEHAEHAGAGALQPRAGSHQNVSVFGAAALWRGAAGGDGYRHDRLHAAGADGAAAGGERRQVGQRKAGGRRHGAAGHPHDAVGRGGTVGGAVRRAEGTRYRH